MIEIKNLSKSYFIEEVGSNSQVIQKEISILKNLNLKIETGSVVAIVGSSGSGKSTLLGLLAGLDQPESGDIFIDGVSLQKLNHLELGQYRSSKIGIVFQQYYLVQHLTAFENLTLPLEILNKSFTHDQVMQMLESVGLGHRAQNKPTQLSGGECQRLAIARSLIVSPSLLLADEPSGSLDSETGEKVMSVFFDQVRKQKTTTILVTHDLELAKRCDEIYKLNHGQLNQI